MRSKIELTDEVWNPTVGCRRVTEGCRNCYAERMASRLQAMGRPEYAGLLDKNDRWNGKIRMLEHRLEQPLHWRKPRRVFVDSMSDLFHEDVSDDFILRVIGVMACASKHTFMILTKRPDRMKKFFSNIEIKPILSCEPLLGPLDLWKFATREETFGSVFDHRGSYGFYPGLPKEPIKYHVGIDWIIVGGESGPHARPMHPDWVRSLRDQCQAAKVSFFFKQWGEWLPVVEQYGDDDLMDKLDFEAHTICLGNRGTIFSEDRGLERVYWCGYQPYPGENPWFLERVGKKAAGRELDGKTWDEFPTSPPAPPRRGEGSEVKK